MLLPAWRQPGGGRRPAGSRKVQLLARRVSCPSAGVRCCDLTWTGCHGGQCCHHLGAHATGPQGSPLPSRAPWVSSRPCHASPFLCSNTLILDVVISVTNPRVFAASTHLCCCPLPSPPPRTPPGCHTPAALHGGVVWRGLRVRAVLYSPPACACFGVHGKLCISVCT